MFPACNLTKKEKTELLELFDQGSLYASSSDFCQAVRDKLSDDACVSLLCAILGSDLWDHLSDDTEEEEEEEEEEELSVTLGDIYAAFGEFISIKGAPSWEDIE